MSEKKLINKKDILISGMMKSNPYIQEFPDSLIQIPVDLKLQSQDTGRVFALKYPCPVMLVKITEEDLKKIEDELIEGLL